VRGMRPKVARNRKFSRYTSVFCNPMFRTCHYLLIDICFSQPAAGGEQD